MLAFTDCLRDPQVQCPCLCLDNVLQSQHPTTQDEVNSAAPDARDLREEGLGDRNGEFEEIALGMSAVDVDIAISTSSGQCQSLHP